MAGPTAAQAARAAEAVRAAPAKPVTVPVALTALGFGAVVGYATMRAGKQQQEPASREDLLRSFGGA